MTDISPPAPTSKTALAPDVRRLDDRAARAWTERMAVRPRDDGTYAVESESNTTYAVDLDAHTCTCPDHRIRAETCKHMRRVAIEISTRRVPPPGMRWVSCVACGTETLAPADDDSPLCASCRLEPGDVVRDGDDRLVVVRVTSDRADRVPIEAADCTVAEYGGNESYPDDDPVVEAVYLDDLGAADGGRDARPTGERPRTGRAKHDDPGAVRRYSFPLSRLERVDDAAIVGAGPDTERARDVEVTTPRDAVSLRERFSSRVRPCDRAVSVRLDDRPLQAPVSDDDGGGRRERPRRV
jgi:hypothetical protein